ncbi:MAG: TonB-dependent receptor [Tannerella sp.]|jgi:TonB-linked SusC/RagA family outer membrane protein|nr:TonB-dependent receptor [Tannerella sp.]
MTKVLYFILKRKLLLCFFVSLLTAGFAYSSEKATQTTSNAVSSTENTAPTTASNERIEAKSASTTSSDASINLKPSSTDESDGSIDLKPDSTEAGQRQHYPKIQSNQRGRRNNLPKPSSTGESDGSIDLKPSSTAQDDGKTSAKTLRGAVSDGRTNEPIAGAAVWVKNDGSSKGTVTDANGQFEIKFGSLPVTLSVSYIGYKTQEIELYELPESTIAITLSEGTNLLDEVVVVGYGVQKKINVVGAVTSLRGEELRAIPATSTTTALSGRLPGVVVIQQNGEPGNLGARLLVRGRSTLGGDANTGPLIVIDGILGRSIDEIDPNDIASLSVLKDASAAIYGAQAANGVILITTRSGKSGKPRLNYNFYQGFMTPTVIPQVCDAAEYATMLSEYQTAIGQTLTYDARDIELFRSGADPWEHPNTDWYSALIRKWTTTSRHNLSIDGGFGDLTYFVSLGYKNDEAMYEQSSTSYDQYNVRAKVDIPINEWLKAGVDLTGFQTHREYPYRSSAQIVTSATRLVPTSLAFWPTGEPGPDVEYGDNPVVTSTFAGGKNDQHTYRVQNTFKVSITPPFVKGLALNASYDYDINNFYRKRFFQPWTLYFPNWNQATRDPNTGFVTAMPLTPTLRSPQEVDAPQNTEDYQRTVNQTFNVNLTYSRTFGSHDVTAYAGFEQYATNYNDFLGYRTGFISDQVQIMNAGANLNKNTTGTASLYARKSYIGRLTYSFQGKYLAEALFRADGSLKFPPNKRWGYFPGVLAGWRASEETVWKEHLAVINDFKLKVSYGKMGMDPGASYQYLNKFGTSSGMVFGTGTDVETVIGPPTVANPDITWETQTTRNLGFESNILNSLFYLNFDYFYNVRDNILAARNASVPAFTGLSLPSENLARVDNHGVEIEAGLRKTIKKDLYVELGGNFSFNRNEVVFQDEPERVVPWQVTTGHPYGTKLMYESIGVFRDAEHVNSYAHWNGAQEGDLIFRDVNGDGAINAEDRILVDNTDAPEIFYGFNVNISYKNFTLSTLFQGQGKYLKQTVTEGNRGVAGNYFKWWYTDRWTPDNRDTEVARAWTRGGQYWEYGSNMNTYFLDNTAYLRLKNVVLTYDVPARYYRSTGITKASINLSGNNLALIYSATDKFDPETSGAEVYPTMKTFAIGANITF